MRWLIWWSVLLALYAVDAEAQVAGELVAGGVIALLAVLILFFASMPDHSDVRVPLRHLRHLKGVPLRMLSDALLVSRTILLALRNGELLSGHFIRLPFSPAASEDPADAGREAITIYGISAAPNTLVADVDPRGELLVHELVSRRHGCESERWPL